MEIDFTNGLLREDLKKFILPHLKLRWDMLMLVEKGTCKIIRGKDGKPFELHEGEIALLPANNEIYREAITPLTFYQFSFNTTQDHPFYKAALSKKIVLPKEQMTAIFQGLRLAYPIINNSELIEHYISYIFSQNYLFGNSGNKNAKILSKEVTSTIRYLNQHLDEKIDIDLLAARVYLSHSALIWKFKQELNTTPSQYLIHLRLRYAKHLLINTDHSITQISELCGYSNPFYFTNAFRKYTGKNPTSFREHHLKNVKITRI